VISQPTRYGYNESKVGIGVSNLVINIRYIKKLTVNHQAPSVFRKDIGLKLFIR
jgi:hypothetical protein